MAKQPVKAPPVTAAYQVTDKAGQWVARQRVQPGDVLRLTAQQAEHELRLGTIEPVGASKAPPVGAPEAPQEPAPAEAPAEGSNQG